MAEKRAQLVSVYDLKFWSEFWSIVLYLSQDMKTISGTVVSSKPISLSKATSILSTFVSTETGASQAMGAYLRRSLASFKELKQLHKELQTNRSERTRKRRRSETADEDGETNVGENATLTSEAIQQLPQESEPKRKKQRK